MRPRDMLRSLAAVLLAAPSSALYYAYDYNGTAPLTADTGTFVAAPRFSVLYGLQTDFNVTADLYVYAGDVCEGLADDTPTKEIAPPPPLHSIARRHRVGHRWLTTTSCCISLARILEQSTPGAASPAPLRRAPCRHTHPVSRSFPTSTYICSLRAACVLALGEVARRNKRRLSYEHKLSREWTSRERMQVEGEDQKPFGNARRSLSSLGLRARTTGAR